MTYTRYLLASIAGAALLAACAPGQDSAQEGSTDSESEMASSEEDAGEAMESGEPTAFTKALASVYQDYADFEREMESGDAEFFQMRADRADRGLQVSPYNVDDATEDEIPSEVWYDMRAQRSDLIKLMDDNARKNHPQLAAEAQGAFDCWAIKTVNNRGESARTTCRDEFQNKLSELQNIMSGAPEVETEEVTESEADKSPDPLAQTYYLFFPFDVAQPKESSMEEVDRVLDLYEDSDAEDITVELTGHADRAGPADYNMDLSERRAKNTRDLMVEEGFPADIFELDWKGETENLVPTDDGVREQMNRRVEIEFSTGGM